MVNGTIGVVHETFSTASGEQGAGMDAAARVAKLLRRVRLESWRSILIGEVWNE